MNANCVAQNYIKTNKQTNKKTCNALQQFEAMEPFFSCHNVTAKKKTNNLTKRVVIPMVEKNAPSYCNKNYYKV